MTLGERLRGAREMHFWKQKIAAKKLGVASSTLSGWEHDYREPDAETLSQLAQLYGVSVDYLVNGDKTIVDKKFEQEQNFMYIEDITGLGETYPIGRIVSVPIVAEISCGEPVFAESNILGTMGVDSQLVQLDTEAEYIYMRAKGNSMINAQISDGSMVLLRLQNTVENGDIAAVCIDNDSATLKRVYFGIDTVTLVPENSTMRKREYAPSRIRIVAKAIWTGTRL